ncbi:radical SAM protein [Desulfurobacterium atlanticum]|uniref:Radical SAM superfamily enzyme with C-terminal helix-hairpin-helix motif n=1 Tax=Desulfurobacterium atlanticum TaxID=240169 RepID=A0A238YD40_9BACT|nr:radical SAM protein [Desulfurobacterium atlanticum]SNR69057.1 Radical SAM superfamily enzyme with C-terminal helix-hairpin-helix motif [Desulfurobacterium atlanticum]
MRITILDGYVDEPTCLGVPPYLATYPRYIAGALVCAGIPEESIEYTTIDAYRTSEKEREKVESADILFVVAGLTVPGRYLGGTPITAKEITEIGKLPVFKIIGGPIQFGFAMKGGVAAKSLDISDYNIVVSGDIEACAEIIGKKLLNGETLSDGRIKAKRTARDIDRYAPCGAFIVKKHPNFPHIICEIETYRGCEREKHCSYCTEKFYGNPDFRTIKGVEEEVKAFYSYGVKYFRIGRQPNILGFMSKKEDGEFPQPNPEAICSLFKRVREGKEIKTLHIDNVNAGTIYRFPEKSKEALKCIAHYDTEGDVAAFGLESADEDVIKRNNLKVDVDGIFEAIKIVNEIGRFKERENGLYKLLPGVNFLVGLPGETKETFRKNIDFLKKVVDNGLLLRRINIRQVMVFEGTDIADMVKKPKTKFKKEFEKFKQFVREEIDLPMMKAVFPKGTVIKDVLLEAYDGGHTLGRQLATYPVLIRIPDKLPLKQMIDIVVVSHRERSLIGLPFPFNLNTASLKLISFLPGISKKAASDIILKRPFKSTAEALKLFPALEKVKDMITV